jgi:serine/threonine protein kinase
MSWLWRKPEEYEKIYKVGQVLGSGTFSKVYLGTHRRDKSKWALKLKLRGSQLTPEQEESLLSEAHIMERLHHPNIIKLKQFFESPRALCLVCELTKGGRLFDRLSRTGPLAEVDAQTIFRQLLSALDYCHTLGIVHRDVKPENIL